MNEESSWYGPPKIRIAFYVFAACAFAFVAWKLIPHVINNEGVVPTLFVLVVVAGAVVSIANNLKFFRVTPEGLERIWLFGRKLIRWQDIRDLEPWNMKLSPGPPVGYTLRSNETNMWITSDLERFDDLMREIGRRTEALYIHDCHDMTTNEYHLGTDDSVLKLSQIGILTMIAPLIAFPILALSFGTQNLLWFLIPFIIYLASALRCVVSATFEPRELRVQTFLGTKRIDAEAIEDVSVVANLHGRELLVVANGSRYRFKEAFYGFDAESLNRKLVTLYDIEDKRRKAPTLV